MTFFSDPEKGNFEEVTQTFTANGSEKFYLSSFRFLD
jgi:hypothetical protein